MKLKLENSLNRDTISKLIDLIRKIADNACNKEYILKLTCDDLEIIRKNYKLINDSIDALH